jgi:hypothetical protein
VYIVGDMGLTYTAPVIYDLVPVINLSAVPTTVTST